MVKHIVMWNLAGGSDDERRGNMERVRAAFETLRGKVPGLIQLEIGADTSRADYACDVVLYAEFDSTEALDGYATHPEHERVRAEIQGLRVSRHQVDYAVP